MNATEARVSIEAFASGNRNFEVAETMMGSLPGASGSVRFMCNGNRQFVAKGARNGKGLVAEYVVARLGQLMEAPVGDIALVSIPDALRGHPPVANMGAGVAHATRYIENLTDRAVIAYTNLPENKSRFARLCVLYSFAGAADHQLFYTTTAPSLVYSLDHGHFFPGGPGWSSASLKGAPAAEVDGWFGGANLAHVDLVEARSRLESVTDTDIKNVLAGPPPDWPFTLEERDTLDTYLKTRRDTLLSILPQA